jgi:PAS domain-containing protein
MLSVTKSLYGLPKKMPMRKKRKVFLNHPLLSWDISNPRLGLTAVNPDVLELLRLCSRDDLVFNPRSVLSEHYDALVLTGSDRRIVWASKGFETMTGFTRDFARGKKPVFFAGAKYFRIDIGRDEGEFDERGPIFSDDSQLQKEWGRVSMPHFRDSNL